MDSADTIHVLRYQRLVIMTRKDDAIFSEALRARFPSVVFLEGGAWFDPAPPVRASIADCLSGEALAEVPYGQDWQPSTEPYPGAPGRYRLGSSSGRSLRFVLSRWVWRGGYTPADNDRFAFDFPTLGLGWLYVQGSIEDLRDETAPVFHQAVWRIIKRISTNRLKTGSALTNELTFGSDRMLTSEVAEHPYWAGHHALEWCAAGGPRRMLDGGYRPCDDWAPPQNRWYQALRRKVEERYGPDFGNPPLEPPD